MDIFISIFLLLIIFLLSVWLLKLYVDWMNIARIVNKIPGMKSYPLFGTTFELMFVSRQDLFQLFQSRIDPFRQLGIFRTWRGISPEIHLLKPEGIEVILNSQQILNKGIIYKFLHPWLGKGLLTNTGSSWHSRRKLLTPAFHFSILENFINVFVEKSEILVSQRLAKLANGKEFDVCPEITRCALDIVCKTAMGTDVNSMSDLENDYVSAIYEISVLTTKRTISIWQHPDFIFNKLECGKRYQKCLEILHGFTNKIIKERKQEFENRKQNEESNVLGMKKRMAFLDLILEASASGEKMSDKDIREEVDTFMFEGHDTTTASICFTLFMLGNNLDIQEKVAQELEDILGDEDRSITMKDLLEMKYLERVIKESLRLYPSVPFIFRENNTPINISGYDIPVGSTIVIHIYDLHRDSETYPDPTKFDPDRFLPENCKNRHPFAFVPFSAGPRNCIGQKFALLEEKTVLASILRKYKIESVDTPEEMKFYAELILRSQNGIKLKMEPRKH